MQSQMRQTTWVRGEPSAESMRLLAGESGLLRSSTDCADWLLCTGDVRWLRSQSSNLAAC